MSSEVSGMSYATESHMAHQIAEKDAEIAELRRQLASADAANELLRRVARTLSLCVTADAAAIKLRKQ